jgi:hypothetical protein
VPLSRLVRSALLACPPNVGLTLARAVDRVHGGDDSQTVRARLIGASLQHPAASTRYSRLVVARVPMELTPPAVLATVHIGPLAALEYFLERLPAEVLALTPRSSSGRPGVTTVGTATSGASPVAALIEARGALRRGAFVCLALDGNGSRAVDLPVFGKAVTVAGGGFALCRWTGAPLFPMAARWHGGQVEIEVGSPIPPGSDEIMAGAFGIWLERYLRTHPDALTGLFAPRLRQAPHNRHRTASPTPQGEP